MTIETRRTALLPWNFPLNVRKAKPGEVIISVNQSSPIFSRFNYFSKLEVVDDNHAIATHIQPFAVTLNGGIIPEPVTHTYNIEKENINHFGPSNRNWRWTIDDNQ